MMRFIREASYTRFYGIAWSAILLTFGLLLMAQPNLLTDVSLKLTPALHGSFSGSTLDQRAQTSAEPSTSPDDPDGVGGPVVSGRLNSDGSYSPRPNRQMPQVKIDPQVQSKPTKSVQSPQNGNVGSQPRSMAEVEGQLSTTLDLLTLVTKKLEDQKKYMDEQREALKNYRTALDMQHEQLNLQNTQTVIATLSLLFAAAGFYVTLSGRRKR